MCAHPNPFSPSPPRLFLFPRDSTQGHVRAIKALIRIYAKGIESLSSSKETAAAMSETIALLLTAVIGVIKNRKVCGEGRVAAVNAIMTNAARADVSHRFMELGGVRALLILAALSPSPLQHARAKEKEAAEGEEAKGGGSSDDMSLRGTISVTLQRIHDATKVGAGSADSMLCFLPLMCVCICVCVCV